MFKKLQDKEKRDRWFYWFMHRNGLSFLNPRLYHREAYKIAHEHIDTYIGAVTKNAMVTVDETKRV